MLLLNSAVLSRNFISHSKNRTRFLCPSFDSLQINDNVTINKRGVHSNTEVKSKINTEKGERLRKRILFNTVLEKIQPSIGYWSYRNIQREKYKMENIVQRSNERTSSIALKYLSQDDHKDQEVDNVEEVEDSSIVHFPYKFDKSHINVSHDSPVEEVEQPQWKDIKYKKSGTLYEKNMDDPSFYEDRMENTPIDEDIQWEVNYGTADKRIPSSSTPCGGCGALLHCQDTAIPGFLPKELFIEMNEVSLRSTICQRCLFLKEFDTALGVSVKAEEYPEILSHMKDKRALVILMVDLLDFPCSIWPDILSIIGYKRPIIVVGNKVDLLVQDGPWFLNHVKECLLTSLEEQGVSKAKVKHVALISAKTGFGVESLITKLHTCWGWQGDVYIVGCTNVGKSTLFNTLIQSDYCKIKAVDLMQRATTSAWPGTTLNLLRFPILRPSGWRLYARTQRLISMQGELAAKNIMERRMMRKHLYKKQASLMGYIGRTFAPESPMEASRDPFSLSISSNPAGGPALGLSPKDPSLKGTKWCHDTPGVVQPDEILHLLTTKELLSTLPRRLVVPRNFHLKPGMTLFIAGLARLDFNEGPDLAWFTVFASEHLPITVTPTTEADSLYSELLGSDLMAVPKGSAERMAKWPALVAKSLQVTGRIANEASADIVLSSAGWVAVTLKPVESCQLTAWTPESRGIFLRTPGMIRKAFNFRGNRIPWTPAYRPGLEILEDDV